MKKYNKKIALILALALTLALAIPALAQTTTIQGAFTETGKQVINVEIHGGSTVRAFLNPNGFPATVYTTDKDAKPIGKLNPSGNITTMPIIGVNKGESPVAVRAAVTSVLMGKFKFVSSAPSKTTTTGLIWLEAKALGDPVKNSAYNLGSDANASSNLHYGEFNGEKVLKALNEWKLVWEETKKSGGTTTITEHENWLDNELFLTTDDGKADKKEFTSAFSALKKTNQKDTRTNVPTTGYMDEIVVLKKGTAESKNQVCIVDAAVDANTPNYFVARLSGRLSEGDTKPNKYWTENDGFGASIVWTFQSLKAPVTED